MTAAEIVREKVLFFGLAPGSDAGHYWHVEGETMRGYRAEHELPKAFRSIDQTMQPGCVLERGRWTVEGPQIEGQALIHFVEGWTAVCFWDRSGDQRSGSNGNFAVFGRHGFEQVIARARKAWPKLFERFRFQIQLVGPDVSPLGVCALCSEKSRWLIQNAERSAESCGVHLTALCIRSGPNTITPVNDVEARDAA